MHYLTLERASKSFGEKILFKDVDLMINKGEKIALIAPNGTGKSSLLRMIAGIDKPEGELATYLLSKNVKVAFLDQDPNFDPESSVIDSVLDADVPAIKAVKKYELAQLHATENPKDLEEALHEMDLHKAWDISSGGSDHPRRTQQSPGYGHDRMVGRIPQPGFVNRADGDPRQVFSGQCM